MSVETMEAVWKRSQHAGSGLLMMLAIADFANDKGVAYPAVSTLAEKTRMKVRNAHYLLSQLQASGELAIKVGAGPRGTNLYRIALDRLKGVQPVAGVHLSAGVQAGAGVQRVAELHHSAEGGAPQCTNPLQPSAPEPSLNHQEPSSIARSVRSSGASVKAKAKARAKADHPLFAEFYAAYPRKVARAEAVRAFATVNPNIETLATMLKAIKAQGLAQRCANGEDRFVPHPATWLNNGRWQDEVASPGGGGDRPAWALAAGFDNRFEAENEGCYAHNADQFKAGKRLVTEVAA